MSETGPEEASNEKRDKKIVIATIIFSALSVIVTIALLAPQYYQNYSPIQPIPFSHKLHAGDKKIPCLYCHGAAEHATFAEVPGLEHCMNCHSVVKTDSPWIQQITEAYKAKKPIKWVKVHVLPDFVHFNHHRHIQAGVDCATCHGPVEKMERVYQWAGLNMGWCIQCHRDNNYLTEYTTNTYKAEKALKGDTNQKPSVLTELLGHKNPHNANLSCSTCHY